MKYAIGFVMLLTACQTAPRTESSATEAAICDAWRQSLVKVSRTDTPETIQQVNRQWKMYEAACP